MKRTTQPARVECAVSRKCRHEYVEETPRTPQESVYTCDDCGYSWTGPPGAEKDKD